MRRFLLSLLVLASVPTLASCGDDEMPMFMILNYQVSCRNTGGCSGIPARQIETLNGEAGHSISCSVQKIDDRYLMNISLEHPDYEFHIDNAVFSANAETMPTPAQNGTFSVEEGDNTYSGPVGGSPPSATCSDDPPTSTSCPIPCRLYDINFQTTANGPAVLGSLFCQGLPLTADSNVTREIHFPMAAAEPADFLIENCVGL